MVGLEYGSSVMDASISCISDNGAVALAFLTRNSHTERRSEASRVQANLWNF
jgi:hypothetical protein